MIRSKRAMGFLWVAFALLFHFWPMLPMAKGQGSRKDDIVFNSRGVPLAGATVRVCAMPASGQPCTPLALIYSDAALTQAISNPTTSDGLGNYFFYAAPGKYEIEISGPSITTKQIPNVILPSDPSSPTFSSLSSTGNINAFSLNLTGNLTVNGNTTVVGNLASGTLNLTNQSSPPGTASSGTVNLYTKTTDKRLYYKDDTGAEIGPISNTTGVQTNVTNTFTASQNFDQDVHTKGPNPAFDIMRFGGYVGNIVTPQTMTCSISSGSTTLSCTSNPDFQNGLGVVVPGAGTLPSTLPSPPNVAQVTPIGVANGSTTYSYQIVLEDYFGGLTAAGTSGSTTAGAATLGGNSVALTGVSRVSGLDTFTCASNCNITAGAQIQISGFVGGPASSVNGTVVVNTTPTSTTFTVFSPGATDYSETASGVASVRACNEVFPGGTLVLESVILRSWIYRNGTLVGVSPGQDPFFIDCGQGVQAPSYVPASAPGSAQVGYLATTISSGGGTNTMTLANAAGTTASSVTVVHDNSPALRAAWAAAYAVHGGVVLLPISGGGNTTFPFNSTLDFTAIPNTTGAAVRLSLSTVQLNQPWVLAPFCEIEGIPQGATAFQYSPLGVVIGSAHPLFLANRNTHGAVRISRLKFSASFLGQSSVVLDQNTGGGGQVGFIFDDDGFSSNAASAVVVKGGFDFWFRHGICSVQGAENLVWFAHPCLDFTSASTYLSSVGTQIPGRIYVEKMNFQGGTAIQSDNFPGSNQGSVFTTGSTNLTAKGILHESNTAPSVRIATAGAFNYGVAMEDVVLADTLNGEHQPLLELTGTVNFGDVALINNRGVSLNPAISGGGTASPVCINNAFLIGCGQTPNHSINGANTILDGGVLSAVNGGSIGYQMAPPAAPASCVVSAGGSVPVTTGMQYLILATDRTPISFTPFAGMTLLSPACSVNTTSGNQTVTVTRGTLPAGAVGWMVWRGPAGAIGGAFMPGGCTTPIPAATTTFVDTLSFGCGTSQPQTDTAFTSAISSGGLSTGSLSITGEAITASPRAEQNIFLPGALTATWTGATWTADKAVTITRVQAQAKTAPAGCTTNAVVRLTDGTTPFNLTISAAANDSGAITQNYAAGAALTVAVQTAAAGCTTSPADVNVVVQYRMQ